MITAPERIDGADHPASPPRLRIVVAPAKRFPSDHAMLEGVFARRLARVHDVRFVMMGDASTTPGEHPWGEGRVHVVRGSSGRLGSGIGGTGRLVLALVREIAAGADVVVVRNSVRLALPALMMRRLKRVPVVFQLTFPVAERTLTRRPSSVADRARALAARSSLVLRRTVLARADLVMAISDAMRDDLVVRGRARAGNVVVVPLGAEPDPPAPAGTCEQARDRLGAGEAPIVLYFGAIAPERQLGFLVQVAAQVAEDVPGALWVLIGPSADGEAARLRASAGKAGLGDSFRVLDPVGRTELRGLIGAAALTVSPIPPDPLFRHSSPTKTVESLALATPVVVTPVGDQGELVTTTGGGIVAPFDVDAFARAVIGLLADTSAAAAMGVRGREATLPVRSYDVLAARIGARLADLDRRARATR